MEEFVEEAPMTNGASPAEGSRGSTRSSTRFLRAATAETARLHRSLERARARVEVRRDHLTEAEQVVEELEDRINVLEGLGITTPVESSPGGVDSNRLAGRSIREVAVRVLLTERPAVLPIHYRDWLSLLETAGYAVAGKRPDAVFLNQVTRSPVVKAAGAAGFYEIDFEAPHRLKNQVTEARRRLAEATRTEPTTPEEVVDRSKRTREFALAAGRVERSLREAIEALAASTPSNASPREIQSCAL